MILVRPAEVSAGLVIFQSSVFKTRPIKSVSKTLSTLIHRVFHEMSCVHEETKCRRFTTSGFFDNVCQTSTILKISLNFRALHWKKFSMLYYSKQWKCCNVKLKVCKQWALSQILFESTGKKHALNISVPRQWLRKFFQGLFTSGQRLH